MIAGLSTLFAVYRIGLWSLGWHRPCSCLGNLTDALHLSPVIVDNVMKVLLAYLMIGSYSILGLHTISVQERSTIENREL